jgi:hypothetical protein
VISTAPPAFPDELENKHIADIVDELVNSAEPSISGGSDSELSKVDLLKGKDGEKGHARTSSAVKKPATFKSVSVNRTFLAAKGSIGAAPVKLGDKVVAPSATGTTQAAAATSARPRFVAKSGSGLAGAARLGAAANGSRAPDPNVVWNKNRRMNRFYLCSQMALKSC